MAPLTGAILEREVLDTQTVAMAMLITALRAEAEAVHPLLSEIP